MQFDLRFVGADGIMLYFPQAERDIISGTIATATQALDAIADTAIIDLTPSYHSILVTFDALQWSHTQAAQHLRDALAAPAPAKAAQQRQVTLPVYYGIEAGPDLPTIAKRTQLGIDAIVALHTERPYYVHAIGFAPGFAYLGEVDERIATPRLPTPRASVPKGAVGIADRQTAVYPATSPGGWNLIGLCPTPLFEPHKEPAMPMAVGDQVQFVAISRSQFLALGGTLPREPA